MHYKKRWYLSVIHDQIIAVFIQKPIPSVPSRDKNKPEDPGGKNEIIFPWVNGLSKAKHIHECRRNICIFPQKSTDMKMVSIPRAGGIRSHRRKKMLDLLETLCFKLHMFRGEKSIIWNTVMCNKMRWSVTGESK